MDASVCGSRSHWPARALGEISTFRVRLASALNFATARRAAFFPLPACVDYCILGIEQHEANFDEGVVTVTSSPRTGRGCCE